ncbi:MAG TPA: VOC family protein [Nocardioides sp.]|uniref:VOC family protein n=1 Tax=Nocardioides sp. TaxID=35761 RepID=UPI002F3E9D88
MRDSESAVEQTPSYAIEVVTVPVNDVDRATAYYRDVLGFGLDVDYAPTPDFRVVQLTPAGSATSIQLGVGLTGATPRSLQGLYLVVTDLAETHRRLTEHGAAVGPIRHKAGLPDWRGDFAPGLDPERRDYASFADLADPDGNGWVLQERGHHAVE